MITDQTLLFEAATPSKNLFSNYDCLCHQEFYYQIYLISKIKLEIMKKQSLNTIAKRFFLGNILAAMFFLSAGANTVNTKVPAVDPSKKIEVKYMGTVKNNLSFDVKFKNESGKSFKLFILDEYGEAIFRNKYSDKLFDKKFLFPETQDINKLTFLIQAEEGSYKEIFDVMVDTHTVADVSVTKK